MPTDWEALKAAGEHALWVAEGSGQTAYIAKDPEGEGYLVFQVQPEDHTCKLAITPKGEVCWL